MAPKPKPPIDRFHGLTQRADSGCLEWTGWIGANGYARHWVDGRNVLAHRWSYEYHVGSIAEGLQIDHLCSNRKCVEPTHLEAVTPSVNSRRSSSVASLRARWASTTHCKNGHPFDESNIDKRNGGRACKTCKKLGHQKHYAENKQTYIDRAAAWHAANPDRSREIARLAARERRAKQKAN